MARDGDTAAAGRKEPWLDPEDVALAQESLRLLGPRIEPMAADLYATLFLRAPELRAMFPPGMQEQRGRLARALQAAIAALHDGPQVRPALWGLGRDHRRFAVRPEHYVVFGQSLISALERHTGDVWVPELATAWQRVFDAVAGEMQSGAREAAGREPAWWRAEVIAHERRRDDIAVLRLRTDRAFDYEPGQHLPVETPRLPRAWRRYSPATIQQPDGTIELHVRSVGAGWVSGALVRHTKVGDHLRLGAPSGDLRIDQSSRRDLLLVAGGTGLAPIRSLLEGLARWNTARRVTLLFGARTAGELYDLSALRVLESRHDWLTVVPVVESSSYDGEQGTLADVIGRSGPWTDHEVVVAGSPAMTTATVGRLHGVGVPVQRIGVDSAGLGAELVAPAEAGETARPAVIDLRHNGSNASNASSATTSGITSTGSRSRRRSDSTPAT